MTETFLFDIAGIILGRLGALAFQEIGFTLGTKNELKKLENTLSAIKAVILGAEEQQAGNHEVKDWSEKLKDVV